MAAPKPISKEQLVGRSHSTRCQKQASYQRAYRAEQTAQRKPSRDDVARLVLHATVLDMLSRDRCELGVWSAALVAGLVAQGFDRDAARRRIDDLIARYADGWVPQHKAYLTRLQND